MSDLQNNIIIDNGTGSIKCGFSGEEAPKSIFSNIISGSGEVGNEKTEEEKIHHPIQYGIIKNFDEMEKIWIHTFQNELRVNSDERNILIDDNPGAPKINREKITQIMFENFNVQGLFICVQPMLSLYSVGKSTGLIIDSGEDSTNIVPIIEGYSFPYSITKSLFGGKNITKFLVEKLKEKNNNFDFNKYEYKKLAEEIKEKSSKISLNYEADLNSSNVIEAQYKLPDGTDINIGKELFICPESIFKPELLGEEHPGIHLQIYNSIMKSEIENRKDLYNNIILSGGNTLLMNFPERITIEVQKIIPNNLIGKLKVIHTSERKYSAWIGGSILAGLGNFQNMWITHSEYQESGPQVVHRKCL